MTTRTPSTWDTGDIDDSGHWVGPTIGCLDCHEDAPSMAFKEMLGYPAQLVCGECMSVFGEGYQ